jgi:hypothetical protein
VEYPRFASGQIRGFNRYLIPIIGATVKACYLLLTTRSSRCTRPSRTIKEGSLSALASLNTAEAIEIENADHFSTRIDQSV